MCGFAGFVDYSKRLNQEYFKNILSNMSDTLHHRGPDDGGIWLDVDHGLGICHRRLSILDLTLSGHQPMISSTGRYVIAFNGEIYNHLEIRKGLPSKIWVGTSDTETILACFEAYGISETLRLLVGMFAIVVWDEKANSLSLIRDRFGEKPLYYGWLENFFIFGSELKALKIHPKFNGNINIEGLINYLQLSYIPAPHTIYKNIYKLMPGCHLKLVLNQSKLLPPEVSQYWSIDSAWIAGKNNPYQGTFQNAEADLGLMLSNSVRNQKLADVPVGSFLSGGIDSTLITAVLQSESDKPISTYTIGFNEDGYNEAHHAKKIADLLGTDHEETFFTYKDAQSIIPDICGVYDEPFADSSQIPTMMLSRVTAKTVKVCLSGDGGDEVFCGYNRYRYADRLIGLSDSSSRAISFGINALSPEVWNNFGNMISNSIPGMRDISLLGDKLYKLESVLGCANIDELYFKLIATFPEVSHILSTNLKVPTYKLETLHFSSLHGINAVERMMMSDAKMYLPDDILVKVDRAGMDASLEVRMPFLDHRIYEFSASLPLAYKNSGVNKRILRSLLGGYLPKDLFNRPKMGFGVPIGLWLRGPLRQWAEVLLSETVIKDYGLLNPKTVNKLWLEHLSGARNWQQQLWNILMLQSWMKNERENTKTKFSL